MRKLTARGSSSSQVKRYYILAIVNPLKTRMFLMVSI